jgi:hypothetical protein
MTEAAQVLTDVNAVPGRDILYPVRDVPATVDAELRSQLDAAVAFADFCVFLTAGAGINHAALLMDHAQALYSETMDALRRQGMPQ